MKIKGSTYFLVLVMVALVLVIISCLRMHAFSSKFLPLLVAGPTLILAVFELVQELKGTTKVTGEGEPGTPVTGEGETTATNAAAIWRGYRSAAIWIVGFTLSIYVLGFLIAIAIFIIAYMKTHGTRWLASIVYAGVTTAAVYGVFGYMMKVDLYPGIIFTLLR